MQTNRSKLNDEKITTKTQKNNNSEWNVWRKLTPRNVLKNLDHQSHDKYNVRN